MDVSGFGSGAFEFEASPTDSAGFINNCHLVVNDGGAAVIQVVSGAVSKQDSALCSQAEAVAHLALR